MNRRGFLTIAGATTASVAGCTDVLQTNNRSTEKNNNSSSQHDSTDQNHEYVWKQDIASQTIAAAGDSVVGKEVAREYPRDEIGIFCLDVETGERQWTFQYADSYFSENTTSIQEDVIYSIKMMDDTGIMRTRATAFNGGPLWSVRGEPVCVTEEIVYTMEGAHARAIDIINNTTIWEIGEKAQKIAVDATDADQHETVYLTRNVAIEKDGERSTIPNMLFALSADDGRVLWRYGAESEQPTGNLIGASDGVAYLEIGDSDTSLIAVSEGKTRWEVGSFDYPSILTTTSRHVLIKDGKAIHALDSATGEEQWRQKIPSPYIQGDQIYGGNQQLSAFDMETGTELWNVDIEHGIKSIKAGNGENRAADPTLFVQSHEDKIHKISTDGDITWTWSTEEQLRGFAVSQFLITATTTSIYGLAPQ